MSITIKEVTTQSDIKAFVNLQFQLYKGSTFWVPPMKKDERNALSEKTNPAMEFATSKFWLALKDGKPVGRIGGIIIPDRNEKTGEKIARFTRVEFIDDEAVADKLFETFTHWAREHEMETLMGPLGFSNLDHQGLLIEGQDHVQAAASAYHHAYYKKHYDRLGFKKEVDWVEFRVTFPDALPEKNLRVANIIRERFKLRSVEFATKKELEPYKNQIFNLFNQAFTELFGTYEIPEKMIQFYIAKYYPILNPNYVKIVVDEKDALTGFIIAMPSLSKALQKAKGSLWPFGWYHLMQAFKHPVEMDLMLGGVVPRFQKLGVSALMVINLYETAKKEGIKFVETTAILENNKVMVQTWNAFDSIQHKRKRCFKKDL